MNSAIELDFWLQLLGILALEIGLVVGVAFGAQALTQSAFWRRAIWQSCFVCLLLLVASEISGAGRGIAVWFAGKPAAKPKVSVRILPPDESFVPAPIENEIPPLMEFSEKPAPIVRAVWWPGILWLAGLALIAARILFSRILFLSLRWRKGEITDATMQSRVSDLARNLGIRRKIHLLESPGFSSPMTFGIAQPCIALPENFAENFNPAEQDAMLAHELAHVVARDPFWYLLADIASALLWWHPLVWLARRRLHSASELAADEAAAIVENGPGTLAECLVNLGKRMTQSRSFGWLGVDGNGFRSHLGQRVERLLNLKPAKKNKLRGWPLFIAKTAFTIFFGGLIVFTSGWIQNGKAPHEKDFASAVQKSWNRSFASMTLVALAEEKANFLTTIQSKAAETPPSPAYEFVNFDAVFYDSVSTEKLNLWSRTIMDTEDDDSITILSSNQLRRVLRKFSDLPHTYDFVGNKFSGGQFFYQGMITNGNECEWITKTENGIARVQGAEMTYASTNPWSFSFIPQKLESSVQINLKWPNEAHGTARKVEFPFDGGAILRRSLPGDPAHSQLILFSSVRVLIKPEAEEAHLAAATLIQDGKLLFEMGRFDEAEIKMNEALKIDSENKAAFYYKSLIKEARYKLLNEARLAPPPRRIELMRPTIPPTTLDKTVVQTRQIPPSNSNSAARTNLLSKSKGRQMIKAKLDRIRLKEVQFENLPLAEVLKKLRDDAKKRDPDETGINFVFNPHSVAAAISTKDPTATVFTPAPLASVDVNEIKIDINPAQHDVRLADVLDLIVGASEQRLEYKIEDYGVVFSPKIAGAVALYTRVYNVDAKKFLEHLESVPSKPGIESDVDFLKDLAPSNSSGAAKTDFVSRKIGLSVRNYLESLGINFGAPDKPYGKSVFLSDRTGLLMVRATLEDLEKVQKAIGPFATEPPQVLIDAKFLEMDEAALQKTGLDWITRNGVTPVTNQTASEVILSGTNVTKTNINAAEISGEPISASAGIFTASQYQTVLEALEKAGGTDILAAPKGSTVSGRRMQISFLDARTIVNGPGLPPSANTNVVSTNGFWSENVFTGPVLDVLPTVSVDGFSIQMSLKGIVSEFLGYHDAAHKTFEETPSLASSSPEPQVRLRHVKSDVNVWDGQTVMLALEDQSPVVPKRKNLFVFVTATIVDPTGKRVHSEKDLSFTTNSVPRQVEQR